MTTDTHRGPVDVLVTQAYKVDGDKASFTFKDVTMKGLPAGREGLLDAFKRSQMGKGDTETIKFTSDDQVTLTGKTAIKLNRVK